MNFTQNAETEKFVNEYYAMWRAGLFKNQRDFCNILDYNYASMNLILNGKRNAPQYLILKFHKTFWGKMKDVEMGQPGPVNIAIEDRVTTLEREMVEVKAGLSQVIPVVNTHSSAIIDLQHRMLSGMKNPVIAPEEYKKAMAKENIKGPYVGPRKSVQGNEGK